MKTSTSVTFAGYRSNRPVGRERLLVRSAFDDLWTLEHEALTVSEPAAARFRRWAGTMLAHRKGAHEIHHNAAQAHTLYQTSTMSALLDGIYDGSVTIAELLEHGDFGVGTFNHLDGEMVVNEGACFHLFSNGEARVAGPDELTPFAAVIRFEADITLEVQSSTTRADLLARIDASVSSENLFYGIRVSGRFASVSTRTAARQEAPYRPLAEATDDESERMFGATAGVLVGFRTPDYEQGISVAGYHLHFLNEEHSAGGHAFDFVLESGLVEISIVSEMRLSLPTSGPFLTADLHNKDMEAEIRQSEG
jgi:acetolactate decarboxylase